MTRLSWVQPEDLLTHGLVAAAEEGRDVTTVRATWLDAGGSTGAPRSGASGVPASPGLRSLASELLDQLDLVPLPAFRRRDEPDRLDEVEAVWSPPAQQPLPALGELHDRVLGGWLGRAAGCLLGKPVEKIPRQGIEELLRATGRWPLVDWFTARGLPSDVAARWPWNRRSAPTSLAETMHGMPEDDDLNFALLALQVLEDRGPGFTTEDVADAWLAGLPAGRVFTAERVAYRNLLLGLVPPVTATRHNPFREWIGAQIRADVHGWTHPGDAAGAARSAWRDARLSHTGAGVHGAMAVAAMCATAVVADDVGQVVAAGLSVVPPQSRYALALRRGADLGGSSAGDAKCLDALYADLGHLHWVHVLNNAALVAFALVRSGGDLGRGICLAVTGGWDTDSDGATVGSLCGALTGAAGLPRRWVEPLRGRLASSLPGFDGAAFTDLASRTVALVAGAPAAPAGAAG